MCQLAPSEDINMPYTIDPKEFGKMQADLAHIKEAVDKLQQTIEQGNYVRQEDADERYILRKELAGLIQLWSFMTSTLGKLISVAVLAGVLYLTFKTIESYPAVKALNQEIRKEARNE